MVAGRFTTAAHAKTISSFQAVELAYNASEGYYCDETQEPIIPGPEHCAKRGLILFIKIAKTAFVSVN